ncbi:unnamed protein product, partial [Nesidiocoris tenuis]
MEDAVRNWDAVHFEEMHDHGNAVWFVHCLQSEDFRLCQSHSEEQLDSEGDVWRAVTGRENEAEE